VGALPARGQPGQISPDDVRLACVTQPASRVTVPLEVEPLQVDGLRQASSGFGGGSMAVWPPPAGERAEPGSSGRDPRRPPAPAHLRNHRSRWSGGVPLVLQPHLVILLTLPLFAGNDAFLVAVLSVTSGGRGSSSAVRRG
jgi:hypothetical protein